MRPLLFIFGLAFVATVLIAKVDAIKCYVDRFSDDDDSVTLAPPIIETRDCGPNITQCATINQKDERVHEGCGYPVWCGRPNPDVKCCSSDLCNGAVTSTPPVPLLIAFIASAIAALGI